MNNRIVVNASPLIAWEKMQALDFIGKLPFDFVCPPQVRAEILAGVAKGYTVNFPAWLQVLSLNAPLTPLALANLDAGEAAVIELALEQTFRKFALTKQKVAAPRSPPVCRLSVRSVCSAKRKLSVLSPPLVLLSRGRKVREFIMTLR